MKPSESLAFQQIEGWLSVEEADALYNAAMQVGEKGCNKPVGEKSALRLRLEHLSDFLLPSLR